PGAAPADRAAGAAAGETGALFEDVTDAAGVRFTYRNGEEANHLAIPESLGGGVALLDYDGDGLLDVFFPGGGFFEGKQLRGHPCKLFRNLGGWKFQDVTAEAGLDGYRFYSHGAAVGDYDNDGWPDLVVTGWGRLALFHNVPAGKTGRRFVEVGVAAGFTGHLWASSAAWADLDGDGYPDLYVCQYGDWSFESNHPTDCLYDGRTRDVCPPRRFKPLPHKVYRNNRDGTFADVSAGLGLRTDGKGLGVVAVDVTGDARPDLYVCNDTDEKFLYVNRSRPGTIRLEEVALGAGCARDDVGVPNGSMGVDAADYANTGRPALWCTNYENELHGLYRNECRDGHVFFQYCTQAAGIGAIGRNWVGWGTGFFDLDHDGWEDLFVANGHAIRYPAGKAPRQQKPVLLRNENGRFTDVSAKGGAYFRAAHVARGAALGDLDNDGRIDLVVSHLNEPAAVLRNVAPGSGYWLGVGLAGADRRDVAGARVTVRAGGRTFTRFAKGGGSYLSSGDRRLVFGLGAAARPEQVEVVWPGGKTQVWTGLAGGRYWRLSEGKTAADPMHPESGPG
ncbi:MAG: UnbV, partial [Gemmataceae bacterium]|nr:UnbV [Gemmataceae bacterium]